MRSKHRTEHKCSVCQVVKSIDNFYATSSKCKPCHRIYDKSRRDRTGAGPRNPAVETARKRRWQAVNQDPVKNAARMAVKRAVTSGLLVRPENCNSCGKAQKRADGVTAIQAHHDDYSKPLEVRWLCAKCHTAWHALNDDAILASEPAKAAQTGDDKRPINCGTGHCSCIECHYAPAKAAGRVG